MSTFSVSDSDLATLLESSVTGTTTGAVASSAAAAVQKTNYKRLQAFQNVTSYSMQQDFHACPRYFQFMKMRADLAVENEEPEEARGSITFAFGHAVGAGVAVYDQTHDRDKAIFAALLAWDIDLLAEYEQAPGKRKKLESFHHAIWAIMQYPIFLEDETDLHDYEVLKLEATIAVDFENGSYYIGHVDELLRNRFTGRLKVKENKTSGFANIDPALYSNSDQALSYSVVTGVHGASEYEVLYTIYSKPEQRWIAMDFVKSPHAKLEWLQGQAFLSSEIEMYAERDFFPKRGGSCLRFGRRCSLYEECDLSTVKIFKKRFDELPKCESFEDLDVIEHLDYRVTWSDIVKNQTGALNE